MLCYRVSRQCVAKSVAAVGSDAAVRSRFRCYGLVRYFGRFRCGGLCKVFISQVKLKTAPTFPSECCQKKSKTNPT